MLEPFGNLRTGHAELGSKPVLLRKIRVWIGSKSFQKAFFLLSCDTPLLRTNLSGTRCAHNVTKRARRQGGIGAGWHFFEPETNVEGLESDESEATEGGGEQLIYERVRGCEVGTKTNSTSW